MGGRTNSCGGWKETRRGTKRDESEWRGGGGRSETARNKRKNKRAGGCHSISFTGPLVDPDKKYCFSFPPPRHFFALPSPFFPFLPLRSSAPFQARHRRVPSPISFSTPVKNGLMASVLGRSRVRFLSLFEKGLFFFWGDFLFFFSFVGYDYGRGLFMGFLFRSWNFFTPLKFERILSFFLKSEKSFNFRS